MTKFQEDDALLEVSYRYLISCKIEHIDVWGTAIQLPYRTLGTSEFGLVSLVF